MCDHVGGRDVDTDESGFLLTWPWPPNPSVWPPSGTTVPLTPPITPTLAWYDPSDLTSLTVVANICSQMNDKSGNGNTQGSGTGPSSGVVSIGGRNALGYNGTTQGLASTAGPGAVAQPITVLMVIKYNATGLTNSQALGDVPTASVDLYQATGKWALFCGSNLVSATNVDTNVHTVCGQANGVSSFIRLDGTQIASGAAGSNGWGAVGSARYGAGTAQTFNGNLGEGLIYASALSLANIQAAEAYLKAKWGTP
jgi:hypothetical protein